MVKVLGCFFLISMASKCTIKEYIDRIYDSEFDDDLYEIAEEIRLSDISKDGKEYLFEEIATLLISENLDGIFDGFNPN